LWQNSEGKTAHNFASEGKHQGVIQLLEKAEQIPEGVTGALQHGSNPSELLLAEVYTSSCIQ
jgi:hypothetical protein